MISASIKKNSIKKKIKYTFNYESVVQNLDNHDYLYYKQHQDLWNNHDIHHSFVKLMRQIKYSRKRITANFAGGYELTRGENL